MIKVFLSDRDNRILSAIKHINSTKFQIFIDKPTNLYEIHHKISANAYIFDSSFISNEIIQFVGEYGDILTKAFIYHSRSQINKDAIRYIKKAKHILHPQDHDEFRRYSNVLVLPDYCINKNLFTSKNNENYNRIDRIAYFLDEDSEIPQHIKKHLYPETKDSKFLLFNNKSIQHPQNLGMLTELDKNDILNNCKYFVSNKYESYVAEAYTCGCVILDAETLTINKNTNSFSPVDIEDFLEKIVK